jgi:hypothetical protein
VVCVKFPVLERGRNLGEEGGFEVLVQSDIKEEPERAGVNISQCGEVHDTHQRRS